MVLRPEQEEEIEVLESIFEGDEAFKHVKDTEFQYKIGEDGSPKSFLLTITWPKDYPDVLPEFSVNSFYNNHLIPEVKELIVKSAIEQAEPMLGDAVTYTVIDWAKENVDTLLENQPTIAAKTMVEKAVTEDDAPNDKKKEKKEQLSKAQKRKLADRVNAGGEHPRGWDWVDVIRHLSQTGGKPEDD